MADVGGQAKWGCTCIQYGLTHTHYPIIFISYPYPPFPYSTLAYVAGPGRIHGGPGGRVLPGGSRGSGGRHHTLHGAGYHHALKQ